MIDSTPSQMHKTLFVIGSTHRTAPLELREQFALDEKKTNLLYRELISQGLVEECLVLNTCNRVEIYGVTTLTDFKAKLPEVIARMHRIPAAQLQPYLFWKTNHETAEHLFSVSAGVDSQMVGETEIFGQVKESYAMATRQKTLGPVLNRLFQRSFKEAKWARTHTGISRGQISIGNVTVELAARIFGDVRRCRLLVLGSGEVAEKTAQAFQSRGARDITVTSRTFENAGLLAGRLSATALRFEHFQQHLHDFDVVVSSTASPGAIINRELVNTVIHRRPSRPLFFIDLAIPRDVAPEVGKLNNVFLYNLDDLAAIANENLASRMQEVDRVKANFSRTAWQAWLGIIRRTPVVATSGEKDPASTPE